MLATGVLIAARKSRSASASYKYHRDYRRFARLRNGERILIRPLRSFDRFRIAKEMERLSDQSRYLRFHRPKAQLTREELRYLTEIDGVNHFALGAADAQGEGLGVARFVRYPDAPHIADAAVVVADRVQGQGLGRLFMQCLLEAAAERGIEILRCEVLPHNRAARSLFQSIAPNVSQSWEDGTAILEIPTTTTGSLDADGS